MNIKPDLTFILKVKYDISKKRLKKENQKIDMISFQEVFYIKKHKKAFLKIAKNKRNYYVLDASNDTDLEKKILSIIKNKLKIEMENKLENPYFSTSYFWTKQL